jgi:hypothetical protein
MESLLPVIACELWEQDHEAESPDGFATGGLERENIRLIDDSVGWRLRN